MKEKILIVEDDPNILLGLQEVLSGDGYEVSGCRRGDEALSALRKFRPDLLVLDIMLPGESGYEICRQVRAENGRLPILLLTAKSQELDKVLGLQLGADDYVTKPFGLRELLARIQALLRRSQAGVVESGSPFLVGNSRVDPKLFQIRRKGKTEDLTPKELKLLQLFHDHRGEVLSRDQILNAVWGYSYYGTTRTLDQTVVQLRRKLGDSGEKPRHLVTVHGVGYKLV